MVHEVQGSMSRNDMWGFYATVDGKRHKAALVLTMCDDRDGNLLTNKIMVATSWTEYFEMYGMRIVMIDSRKGLT